MSTVVFSLFFFSREPRTAQHHLFGPESTRLQVRAEESERCKGWEKFVPVYLSYRSGWVRLPMTRPLSGTFKADRSPSRLSPDNPGAKQTSRMFYRHCHCVARDVGPYYTSRLNQLQSLERQKRKTSGKALLCSVQP